MLNADNPLNKYIYNNKNLIVLNKKSKQPFYKGWQNNKVNYVDIENKYNAGYNIGFLLSEKDLIIDVDFRNFPKGKNSLQELEQFLGFKLTEKCPTVITGADGYHFYMKKSPDIRLQETIEQFAGIEFKSKGRQVVCAGSIHPVTDKKYRWLTNNVTLSNTPEVPEKLVELLKINEQDIQQNAEMIRLDQLADLLSQLPIEDFSSNDLWFPIMCASHHATNGEGIDEFLNWSLKDPKYANCEHEIRQRWKSLGGKKLNYTVRTLYKTVLTYGGDVNRIIHDFDGLEDIENDSNESSGCIAVKLSNALTENSPNGDIIKALKASLQADAISMIKAQKTIMQVTKLSKSDLNKIIADIKEKLIDDMGRKLAENTLKNQFHNGKYLIMNDNAQFWFYTGTHWKPIIKDYVGKIATVELDNMRKQEIEIEIKENTVVSDAVSIIARLTSSCNDRLRLREKRYPVINCLNGELWLDRISEAKVYLRPHNPDSYLLSLTNVKYDPNATCPMYDKALKETFKNFPDRDDIIRHFHEFIGYILHPDKRPAHWWLLQGAGGDGKTTQMKIISALLGDAVVPDSIERYKGGAFADSHATSDLVGKLLVYDDDLNKNTVLPDGTLKKLSEDGELTANPKGYQPFKFVKVCTVVMCCNGLPKTKDVSRGFRRRAMVIPFDRGFTSAEMLPNLADDIIKNELSGVLNRALAGMIRLKKRGYFQEPESCIRAKQKWLDSANPVSSFVNDCIEKTDSKDRISLPELYQHFVNYCDDMNYSRVPPKSDFQTTLDELGLISTKTNTHSKKYIGIKLKNKPAIDDFEE